MIGRLTRADWGIVRRHKAWVTTRAHTAISSVSTVDPTESATDMGYAIGTGEGGRDIGYGVIATCDHPKCDEKIDRGMSYCCGEYTTEHGCGLYFCSKHLQLIDIEEPEQQGVTKPIDTGDFYTGCDRCAKGQAPYDPKPDHPDWVWWKLNHHSWARWRKENNAEVQRMRRRLKKLEYKPSDEMLEWVQDE